MSKGNLRLGVMLICLFSMFGCGSGGKEVPLFSVKGILKVGGKPVPDVDVHLMPASTDPKAMISSGRTNKEGKFNVAATNGRQGAMKGKYKVVLAPLDVAAQEEAASGGKLTAEIMAEKYKKHFNQKPPSKGGKGDSGPVPSEFLKKETSPRSIEVVDKPLELELDL